MLDSVEGQHVPRNTEQPSLKSLKIPIYYLNFPLFNFNFPKFPIFPIYYLNDNNNASSFSPTYLNVTSKGKKLDHLELLEIHHQLQFCRNLANEHLLSENISNILKCIFLHLPYPLLNSMSLPCLSWAYILCF